MNVIDIALAEIGVEEQPRGSNKGKRVEEYLHSVGLVGGYPWCMAFVYWCFEQLHGESNPLIKTGGALNQWNITEKSHRSAIPVPGCVFIMDFGSGKGHTGIVASIEGENIHTIEGNAAHETGTREGYEVCRKVRKIVSCKGFIIV